MNPHSILSGILVTTLLLGCSGGSGSSSGPAPTISASVANLGFCTTNVLQVGDAVAFLADEAGQGATDLNGDGDALDRVLLLHDAATGTTTNVGLAAYDFRLSGDTVAILVDEADQGGADLNGNMNPFEEVMHVVDVASGSVTNLELASNGLFEIDGGVVVFTVLETVQGLDLNTDGDTVDDVLFAHDTATGIDWNLELATETSFFLDGGFLLAVVSEQRQGQTDLNGDGDFDDHVAHLVDLQTFQPTNLELAVDFSFQSAQGLNLDLGAGLAAIAVHEASQGDADLNGDGDRDDAVVHVIDIASGSGWNTGVSAYQFDYALSAGKVLFSGSEGAALGVRVFDVGTATLVDTGVEGFVRGAALGQAVLDVSESANGVDLNGDGDAVDDVLAFFDLATSTIANSGLATFDSAPVDATGYVIVVREAEQGNADLNHDGDTNDKILYRYDTVTGRTRRLDTEGDLVATVDGVALGCLAFEEQDLNADGDVGDLVLQLAAADTGATLNVGLAGFGASTRSARAFTGSMPFLVDEAAQGGTDLNGDGDVDDQVLHLITPLRP